MNQPNIILVVMDDMGYGDTECYGPSLMRTPTMKRIGAEGATFSRMYTAPTCSPARAQILTGCYAQRVGIPRVLFPKDTIGLRPEFPTIATHLRAAGYATFMAGKWHLGARPEHFPIRHGFDEYFGLLYSNDMAPLHLYRNETVVEEVVNQAALTRRYSEEVIHFIEANRQQPFFCYLAHTMPHIPLHVEDEFRGRSRCGLYGDTIECIDHYLGQIVATLENHGLSDNTLVIVTSDNGPWYEGSVNGVRGRKFDVYEGGIRVPFVARWPREIPVGVQCREPAHLMDLLPTFLRFAGLPLPATVDGLDIGNLFRGEGVSPHDCIFLYRHNDLDAVIRGKWKLHLKCQRGEYMNPVEYPKLHDLEADPDESYSLTSRHPDIVADLTARIREFDAKLHPYYVSDPVPK
jgi:uncharacterized sulfatase